MRRTYTRKLRARKVFPGSAVYKAKIRKLLAMANSVARDLDELMDTVSELGPSREVDEIEGAAFEVLKHYDEYRGALEDLLKAF